MKRAAILLCLLGSVALLLWGTSTSEHTVRLRSAVELFKGSGTWPQVDTAIRWRSTIAMAGAAES